MSCDENQQIEIVKGGTKTFTFELEADCTKYDLTGASEIVVCFKGSTTDVIKKLSDTDVTIVGSAVNGKISVKLLPADTRTFPDNIDDGSIEVDVDLGSGENDKWQFLNAFTVKPEICPNPLP